MGAAMLMGVDAQAELERLRQRLDSLERATDEHALVWARVQAEAGELERLRELARFVREDLCTWFAAEYAREVDSIRDCYGAQLTQDHHAWSLFGSRAIGTLAAMLESEMRKAQP